MKFCSGLLLATLLLGGYAQAAGPPEASTIDVLHYRFELALEDASDRIEGEATVSVVFTEDEVDDFSLDLVGAPAGGAPTGMTVTAVTHAGEPVEFSHRKDRLRIRLDSPAAKGENRTFTIEYHGVPADGLIISTNKFGDRTFFGDNWPNRARNWLPTHDHPSDKARVDWVVRAPDHYEIIANGRLVEETNLEGPWERTHWRSQAPLPTYVMVVGAAPFAVQHLRPYKGTPVQSWVFPENREAGFHDFARGRRILAFFEERIGEFPYVKLANVQSKTRFGGMENASAIFYNENAVTGDRSSELLLAHEIAHQWFGDAVTEDAWADLWLSEGFATYLANLYMGHTYGRDSLRSLMRQDRRAVRSFAREHPEEPLVDSVFATPLELLNPNSYEKGGWVLHMLRDRVGEDVFWSVVEAFYARHKHSNATTQDFKQVAEDVSGQQLDSFFRQWTRRAGVPAFAGDWTYDEGSGRVTVTLRQTQKGAPYRAPLDVGAVFADGTTHLQEVQVDERAETFSFEVPRRPSDVVLDPNVELLMAAQFDVE